MERKKKKRNPIKRKNNASILLGVTGSIAAYKAAYLASLMKKRGHGVKVVMTRAAEEFITPLTFSTITGEKTYTGLFDNDRSNENHTSLSAWADIIVLAPATADSIARICHGIADDLLTSVVLDFPGPVAVFPAMHSNMWNNPATKENVEKLKKRGMAVIGPASGALAGGKKGTGRMIEPEDILSAVEKILKTAR
ncbi:MAG: hypothetical protein JXJ19_05975 [Elusimicrobia bacterium]|nr:hypothetical protein [Elusimicrobiota bacterium]